MTFQSQTIHESRATSIRDQLSNLNQTDFNSYTAFEAEFDKLELQLRECVSNAKNHPPVNSL